MRLFPDEYALWEKLSDRYRTKLHEKRLAAIYRDQLPGGAADDKTPVEFDQDSLKEGAEEEMEHTYDPELAQEIAMDHLVVDPDYYRKLKQCGLKDKTPKPTASVKLDQNDYYKHWKGGF